MGGGGGGGGGSLGAVCSVEGAEGTCSPGIRLPLEPGSPDGGGGGEIFSLDGAIPGAIPSCKSILLGPVPGANCCCCCMLVESPGDGGAI